MLSATVATLLLSYAGTLPAGRELNSSAAGTAYDTWLAEGIARGFIVAADAATPEATARKPMFASTSGEQIEARGGVYGAGCRGRRHKYEVPCYLREEVQYGVKQPMETFLVKLMTMVNAVKEFTPKYEVYRTDAYCKNRGEQGDWSMGERILGGRRPLGSVQECAAKVWASSQCGFGFSFSPENGACDCSPVGEHCDAEPFAYGSYAVYDFDLAINY